MPDLKRIPEDAGLVDVDVALKAESHKVIERWMPRVAPSSSGGSLVPA
eukprot:CAMPEP_0194330048 /NCGR_PEP_ID=MMETSP0171-20130528/50335_1 /TAXON_ID=218684 /ORGANISM="Corethron pennatum, Strain L29A3" /LENGTH=47 /DNA_ID= /DNA_START= /DNA_END= /DNA_ORIENTATION=